MGRFPKRGCLFDTTTGAILSAWEVNTLGDYDQHLEFLLMPDGTRRPLFDPARHCVLDLEAELDQEEIYTLYRSMENARVRQERDGGPVRFTTAVIIDGAEVEIEHPLETLRKARQATRDARKETA